MSRIHLSSSKKPGNCLPSRELDDLCSPFVLNAPEENHQSFKRIWFLVEYAYWYYEDNVVNDTTLNSLTLKEFTWLLFNSYDVLRPYVTQIDDIFKDITSYKCRVPITGTVIQDETYERVEQVNQVVSENIEVPTKIVEEARQQWRKKKFSQPRQSLINPSIMVETEQETEALVLETSEEKVMDDEEKKDKEMEKEEEKTEVITETPAVVEEEKKEVTEALVVVEEENKSEVVEDTPTEVVAVEEVAVEKTE